MDAEIPERRRSDTDLTSNAGRSAAFRFVFIMGIVSLFADMTYEGARSVLGPFFAALGASGAVVGVVAGAGELIGYALRYASGHLADRTRRYWPIAFAGYAINLLSVPALGLARSWPVASMFTIGERFGRGVRKPANNAMISYAGSQLGQGWVFGFREAMDQTGATIGPLLVAGALAIGLGFNHAFALLAIPAFLSLVVMTAAWRLFPVPSSFEKAQAHLGGNHRAAYWIYAAGAACLAAGFADFPLISYHFAKAHVFGADVIPVIYAAAMLSAAVASIGLGRLYDRFGTPLLVITFIVVAAYTPLAFLFGGWVALIGAFLWGIGMGAQDALFPALVAKITPQQTRASALGTFDAIYGIAWFAGSALMGLIYDRSLVAVVIFGVSAQLVGVPLVALASTRHRHAEAAIAK